MIDFGVALGSLLGGFTVMVATTKCIRKHSGRITIGQLGTHVLGVIAGIITYLAIYCGYGYLLGI